MTTNSIKVEVTGLDTSFKNNRDFDFYIDGDLDGSLNDVSPTKSSVTYTYTGLDPDTEYDLEVVILWAGTNTKLTTLGVNGVWTRPEEEPEPDPPEPWSWSSSNGDATRSQTQAAYNALVNGGACENFSYKVWNDMCDKVKEVIDFEDEVWQSKYASLSATKMSSSDKTLTAKRFNSLNWNVTYLRGSGVMVERNKGDAVRGRYILEMMELLNEYIDDL